MAASAADAHPYPIYNARFRVTFPILDADGDLVTGAAGLDSEVSQNQGTFADCTNEATEIATNSGMYYLDLIATELDNQQAAVIVKTSTSGAKTTPMVLYPKRLPVIRTGMAQAGGASTITLDSGASAVDNYYAGCYINVTNNSPANALGQARLIVSYVGSTKVATVEGTYGTNPDSTSTFEVLATDLWIQRLADLNALLGSAIAPPSVAGVPEVDVTHLNGVAQSLLDLKDFADDGYDPATNKVQGVVLVDTLTTYTGNTPQTGDSFARLGAPAGASVSADIAAIEAQTDDIGVAGAGLTALGDVRIANLDATVSSRASAAALVTVQADTDDIQTRLPAALVGGRMNSDAVAISGSTAAADAVEANIANLDATVSSRATPAQVNTQVVDALATDTYAEPTGVPGATVSIAEKTGRVYQALRNALVVDSNTSKLQFKNDGGTIIWEKDLTDAGGVYEETEGNAP